MRADRLISIVLLLQVHHRLTARDLAERLEVSERTIHRDMEALSSAGIPVYAERGVGGGWRLLDGYETNLTGLSEAEIQTIFLSKPARLLTDLGLQAASESALNKLLAALPTVQRREAEQFRQRVYIDAGGWPNAEEDVSHLSLLQEAIWQERRIKIVYELRAGPVITPIVDPLGLVAKGNTWYLVALFQGEIGVYRLSRIFDARALDEPSERPQNFDLASFWRESSAKRTTNASRYVVDAYVCTEIISTLRCHRRVSPLDPTAPHAVPPPADGWHRTTLLFTTKAEACAECLSYGPQLEVIAPSELRVAVQRAATATASIYG